MEHSSSLDAWVTQKTKRSVAYGTRPLLLFRVQASTRRIIVKTPGPLTLENMEISLRMFKASAFRITVMTSDIGLPRPAKVFSC